MTGVAQAYLELIDALERMELPYAVGGSIASGTFGVPRATQDIDLVVDITPQEAFDFASLLQRKFAVDPDEARDKIGRNQSFNLIHAESVSKFDIFPATFFAHGREEIRRRRMVEGIFLAPDDQVPVVSPEDIILAKLAWYRLGNERSERQWQDVESVWGVVGGELDRGYLTEWATKMGTADLLLRLMA